MNKHLTFPQTLIIHMNEPTRFFKVFITKHKETLNLSINNQLIPIGAFAEK